MLAQGLSPNFPKWVNAIEAQVVGVLPLETEDLAVNILRNVLEPNLAKDHDKTLEKVELAAQDVTPVEYKVRQNEVIVKIGEKINRKAFVLLDYFRLSRRRVNWRSLVGFVCLVSASV